MFSQTRMEERWRNGKKIKEKERNKRKAIITRKSLSWENNKKFSHRAKRNYCKRFAQKKQHWEHSTEKLVIIVINSGKLKQHEKGGKRNKKVKKKKKKNRKRRLTILFTWTNLFLFYLDWFTWEGTQQSQSQIHASFSSSSTSSSSCSLSLIHKKKFLGIFTGKFFFLAHLLPCLYLEPVALSGSNFNCFKSLFKDSNNKTKHFSFPFAVYFHFFSGSHSRKRENKLSL